MSAAVLWWLAVATTGLALTSLGGLGAELFDSFAGRKLEALCRLRQRMARFYAVIDHKDQAIEASEYLRMIGTVMFLVGGTVTMFQEFDALTHGHLAMWAVAAGATMMLLHTWVPVAVTRFASKFVLFYTWPLWRAVIVVFAPLSLPGLVVSFLFRRVSGAETTASEHEESLEDEIRTIVAAGTRKKYFDTDVQRMINGVMTLHEVMVWKIMSTRGDIDGIDIDWSWEQVFSTIVQAGRTRFPVYRQSLDDIVGVLYVKDLLPFLIDGTIHEQRLEKILRRPWMVPAEKTVESMLREFLHSRSHMAIVIDGHQQTTGVVTIEDALERIVGEIVDESDQEDLPSIDVVSPEEIQVHGRARVDDVNDKTGWDLPISEDYDTIAGYVLFHVGVFPEAGSRVRMNQFEIEVVEASPRKIESLRVRRLEPDTLERLPVDRDVQVIDVKKVG